MGTRNGRAGRVRVKKQVHAHERAPEPKHTMLMAKPPKPVSQMSPEERRAFATVLARAIRS